MSTFHAYVDAAHFHEALGNVLRFAAKRSRLPILEEAQVRFEDGHCVLTCTNLDQWCMSTIPAVGDSFSFVFVGTRKILSACKYFSGELELTYTIEPTETNPDPRGQISISDGKRSLKRSTERTSDFPELKEKPLDRHYPVNPKRLLERFKRVKYAVSSNDARPNQCCIEFLKDKIIAVDGYRLAMSTDPAVNVEKPFYIPPEVMAELTMFKDQDCTISVGEEWAAVESETLRVLTRIPGYDGFDVERAIPTSFSTEYPVDVDQLLDEVRYDTPYPHFPIPRLVFGFSLNQEGKASHCRIGVVADEIPTPETPMYYYPFSNVSRESGSLCVGANTLPIYKKPHKAHNLPAFLLSIPNNMHYYSSSNNKLGLEYRELMEHLKDKDPEYYYSDILIPKKETLGEFIQRA